MMESFSNLGRYVSICDRLMKMYYDRGLSEFEIGWGQQFYVEYLYDHPGASPQEMVSCIHVDKATLTKIIKKLTEVGYPAGHQRRQGPACQAFIPDREGDPGGHADQADPRRVLRGPQRGDPAGGTGPDRADAPAYGG